MRYKCVRFTFPRKLTKEEEETFIDAVQYIRDQAIIAMRRSESDLMVKLAEKLTPEQFKVMSNSIKERLRIIRNRMEHERTQQVVFPLLSLENEGETGYVFMIDAQAFDLLSFKTTLPIVKIDINLDYADKVIRKIKGSFKDEIAPKIRIPGHEIKTEDFLKEIDEPAAEPLKT